MKLKPTQLLEFIKHIVIFGVFFLPSQAYAQTASTTATTTLTNLNLDQAQISTTTLGSVLGQSAQVTPPLLLSVKEAKLKLGAISLKHTLSPVYKNVKNKQTGKTTKTITSYNLANKEIAVAVLNPATGEIKVVVGKQSGKTMNFPASDTMVKLARFNGVNSKFSVESPENGQVIALKYLITNPESGSKAKIEAGIYEAVYVPYNPEFATPEILAYGANYLNNIVKLVSTDLQNLPSQSVPGLTIIDAIKPSLIKALVYAEHTDTTQVLKNNAQSTIDQLNILFALNEGDAYKYSVSSAGARGIAQFIPSTYASLVKRHPDANLIADFVDGMSSHENAIKAMYLLLDDYGGAVRVKASLGFASGRVFDYAAASYNGGTTRVARAINAFGDTWNEDRNGQINTLKQQVSSFSVQIKNLKAKIKNTADKKAKASLQAQLTKAQSGLNSSNAQLNTLQPAALRQETVNYLQKVYKVIQFFNSEELAMR